MILLRYTLLMFVLVLAFLANAIVQVIACVTIVPFFAFCFSKTCDRE